MRLPCGAEPIQSGAAAARGGRLLLACCKACPVLSRINHCRQKGRGEPAARLLARQRLEIILQAETFKLFRRAVILAHQAHHALNHHRFDCGVMQRILLVWIFLHIE